MAQTKQTTTAKKKAPTKTASTKSTAAKAKTTAAKRAPEPEKGSDIVVRRGVGAVICLLLALFSFIGYFNVDAWFITYFCGFIKGIFGVGYYIFPPALIVCTCTLVFGNGKNLWWRIVSALLLPLILGAFCHLFLAKGSLELSGEVIKTLYADGKLMQGGGFLSGMLANLFNSAFSAYGAYPVFFLAFAFFAVNSVGITIPKLIREGKEKRAAAREQRQLEISEQQHEYARTARKPAPAPVPAVAPTAETIAEKPSKKPKKGIDIPVDEPIEPVAEYKEEKVGFFNKKPRVKTPDQILSDEVPAAKEPEIKTISGAAATENVKPLTVAEAATVAGVETAAAVSSEAAKPSSPAKKITHDEVEAETAEITKTIEAEDKKAETDADAYQYPPMELLKTAARSGVDGKEEITLNRERLESTIRSFGVSGSIIGVTRGPTVTRYDLELEQGVKLAKLTNLAGDLALALGVSNVRIAPIPDKISTVGIEVPNKQISTVFLHDIIGSGSFKSAASKLTFAIGEDIGGNAIVGNISKLPHMLIAGTTGSGKSVCMNSLILSLLYKATPDEVRLIMIDPKMVELGIYNGIPHLYVPVVTDPKKAAGALQWSVVEMLKRYRLFSEVGVRDLAGYNAHQKSIGEPTMPAVVIVIDELADLMLVASKEVEESVCRVAQMGRAAGMHLVIATQRPSADVITGLMKANIPSRIAFAVSSAMESRIILDASGAEKLIGAGDMLYFPLGAGKPLRVQGAFVSDEEREKVISFVKSGAEANYSEDILRQIEKAAEQNTSSKDDEDDAPAEGSAGMFADYDELLPQAVDVIFETKQASVSMLQRRLKLGYARAARIVDQMEELGVVGPFEGSKPRQIIITKQQWQEMQTVQGTAPLEQSGGEQVSFSDYEDTPPEEWKE